MRDIFITANFSGEPIGRIEFFDSPEGTLYRDLLISHPDIIKFSNSYNVDIENGMKELVEVSIVQKLKQE